MGERELLEYFIQETNKRFDKIDNSLEKLSGFRMMAVGGMIVISTLVSVAISILFGK